ncbi:subtilisin-like protease SBT1.7 [Lolium perenne]|uniref:subtilisin-like protease SBT1.7 n=1 Tax=Lolium perenne TaxID=4522 RepID=UPI0021EB409D|nr:subtilisin-like protease SBT1.7 [Lolium perenne]
MASMISLLSLYSLLVLVLVQSTHSAIIPEPKNSIAEPKPDRPWSSDHIYIVQTNHLAKPSKFATLERWYASMVDTYSPRATTATDRILYTYGTVMHGFTVRLTDGEARRMSTVPGVTHVYKDRVYHTQTTRSPWFMGLHDDFGAWPDSEFGDGIIIGFIDTGIWPERASFNDTGLGPVRSTWRGNCVDAAGFNATLSCNNKLVGAKSFTINMPDLEGYNDPSPRDIEGHGTHVSSTAAGAEVPRADLYGFSGGRASGVARNARIAMYKACVPDPLVGCPDSAVTAAIDAAVSDGVDLISISLGGRADDPFYNDALAVATFGAVRRGVFVVLAGGNSGPEASSVSNVAPWMTTVGATTTDRVFPATLRLGNGVELTGQSLYTLKSKGTSMLQLVYSSCGEDDLTLDKVMGKVVVCTRMAGPRTGFYVEKAGGAGMVSPDGTNRFSDAVLALTFTLPGVMISHTAEKKLNDYMASSPYPVASFAFACDTVTGENRAPMVAGFSSRGPSVLAPEILKPDLVAPGVNILAAWSGDAPPSSWDNDTRRVEFNILSGTSMACPHVAGAAALIKKVHGDWTPAMVRSALMTTAGPLDKNGRDIVDSGTVFGGAAMDATPLAAGAGLVLPRLAMDPGLVYDAGTQDYVDFLCTLNYTAKQMRQFAPEMSTGCGARSRIPGGVANVNYPSFVVVFSSSSADGGVRTLTRTVTKVSAKPETYNVTFAAPEGVAVTVTPTTLEFIRKNEKRSYTVEFSVQAQGKVRPAGTWDFGHISWENRKHRVRSPVAFNWQI